MNIILGITGSVSAYKTPWLVRDLRRAGHDVRVVMSSHACKFVAPLALESTSQHPVIVDSFDPHIQESGSWHVHLAQWANAMLVAPCSAATLARLATAQCDSSVVLVACSLSKDVPLLVAPGMDSEMWHHPATQRNVGQLRADGVHVIDPDEGELASGLVGKGRLPDLETLVAIVALHLPNNTSHIAASQLQPEHAAAMEHGVHHGPIELLVTAGPTHEPIDAVRSIVNHSTGTMGFAIAEAAAARGMLVTLVSGPVHLPTPQGVERLDVTTAAEMFEAVQHHATSHIVIMAAAVADFTPELPFDGKIKKTSTTKDGLTLQLKPTADILTWLGTTKHNNQVVVGFALETEDVIEHATEKLHRKHADIIVANKAGIEHSGFGTGMNTITLITHDTQAPYPPMPKRACAEVILDAAITMLAEKEQA